MKTPPLESSSVLERPADPIRTWARGGDQVSAFSLADRVLLIAVLASLVVLYAPTFVWLYARWTMSVWQHAHGLLIPPLVAYYVFLELQPQWRTPSAGSAWGFALLVPALGLHVLDTGIHTQIVSAASIVVALPGLALLFLGWDKTRSILFPLLFTAFMLPIPLRLTEPIQLVLRKIVTETTAFALPLLNIPVLKQGTSLTVPQGTVLIADACSGFSTLYASLAVAALVAYGTRSVWRRVLVIGAAVPVAVAANAIRMVLLMLLVQWNGVGILETRWHPFTGMLTFALALPVLFWLGNSPKRAQRSA